jgi:hypothetical protein
LLLLWALLLRPRLKKRLRLCNLLSLCCRFSVGEAALPTRTITATSAKVKHVVYTTAGISLDLRPICNSLLTLSHDVFIARPPLVICFELLPLLYTRSACALKSAWERLSGGTEICTALDPSPQRCALHPALVNDPLFHR